MLKYLLKLSIVVVTVGAVDRAVAMVVGADIVAARFGDIASIVLVCVE